MKYIKKLCGNKYFVASLTILLFLIVFYRDVVFDGRTFLMETATIGTMSFQGPYKYEGVKPGFVANDPSAISLQSEPFNRFISKIIKKGDFPLWNPYAGLAGNPLLADGHTGPFEPIQFLFFLFPDRFWPYTVDAQVLLRFFLAGFFCYLFAQRLKIGFLGSITSSVLFMLSSFFITSGNHADIKPEALLPIVLYGYDRLADLEDRPGFLLCAVFIGWAIIAAMPEPTFFTLILGMLWYFHKSIFMQKDNLSIFNKSRLILIRYVSSTILGFLISAAYLLPFLEFVSLGASVHSTGNGVNWGGNSLPLWYVFSVILRVDPMYYNLLGIFACFIFVSSLLSFKDQSKFRPTLIFFSLYAIFFILIIFDFPFTAWTLKMPVFDRVVMYRYPIPSVALCLTVLSGIFVDEAYNKLSHKKILISLLVLLLFFLVVPSLKDPENFWSHLPKNEVIIIGVYLTLGWVFALHFLTFLIKSRSISRYAIQVILLLMLVVEPFYWGSQIKRPDRYDPYFQKIPPFINYLRDDKETYRIFSLGGILWPNISTAYEIFDIRWLNALVPQRAYDFTAKYITPDEPKTMRFTGTAFPISSQMFNLLNVKYVLMSAGQTIQSSGLTVPRAAPESTYTLVHQDHDVAIYQNKNAFPRAFVVYDIIGVANFNEALDALANPTLDLAHTAIVESPPADLLSAIKQNEHGLLSVSGNIKLITPNSLAGEIETSFPGLLVVSDQYYPGWHAYVDGHDTPIYAVDGILQGVFLTAGKHAIRFDYQPLSFLIGAIVSLISLISTIVLMIFSPRIWKNPHESSQKEHIV